jgi:hypothetical protein
MKQTQFFLFVFLFIGISFTSCKQKEVITIDAFTATLTRCIDDGQVVGTVNANATKGTVTYSFTSQSVAGAFAINASTGQITIANNDVIYDAFYGSAKAKSITLVLSVTNGSVTETATITIVLDLNCA